MSGTTEWFGDISNPESVIALITAISAAVGAIGKVAIDLGRKYKAGEASAQESLSKLFKDGAEFGMKAFKEAEQEILKDNKKTHKHQKK